MKRLDNGISESWKVILSKLSIVEDNECKLSLCVTIQRRVSLRAELQHTIELQLAKNRNQAKTKRRVEFNSLGRSFWYEFVAPMLMVEVIHQHTTTRDKNTHTQVCVSVSLSAHFPLCCDALGWSCWFWKDSSSQIHVKLLFTLFIIFPFFLLCNLKLLENTNFRLHVHHKGTF